MYHIWPEKVRIPPISAESGLFPPPSPDPVLLTYSEFSLWKLNLPSGQQRTCKITGISADPADSLEM